ncbi:Aspartate aminotransferase 3 [Hibiscus syriacus]|uniref:Aspartate aminotransferase 3 n=1 Tax=Hibiscus syriacus TaxID=106335 RepID=A0A6A2Z7G9_HIBSY|nr:Aspartate aminotransferase 3 [Hibiscus syriacus]
MGIRTDNAIKNHWNSSVKKKLDSYIEPGLLEQFQFPILTNQSQPLPSLSSTMTRNVDDSGAKCSTEAEDMSECSQEPTMLGCSQSISDSANASVNASEISGVAKEKNSHPVHSSEVYCPSLEVVNISIPEIPVEAGYCTSGDYQFGLNAPTSLINTLTTSDKQENMLTMDEECSRVLFSDAVNDGCFVTEDFTQGYNMVEFGSCTHASLSQASDIQKSENGRTPASQSTCPSSSKVLPTSCCQSFVSPSVLLVENGTVLYGRKPVQLNGQPFGTQEQELPNVHDGFVYTSDDYTEMQEQSNLDKNSLKLVPVNTFGSESNAIQTCPIVDDKPNSPEEQDDGGLCYEPPRFPSLDIPFFSCDLISSVSDDKIQEYSPFGIRQLMMSSMNCISPFRLPDSPLWDDSPDAVLKSVAKTITGIWSYTLIVIVCITHMILIILCTLEAQRPSAVLVEHNLNDLLFLSPYHDNLKGNRALSSGSGTPRKQYHKSSGAISNQGFASECSSGNACIVVSYPTPKIKRGDANPIAVTAVSATLENSAENAGNAAADDIENCNMFGKTPLKISMESPSAWKSPWFINSFVPGPRIDTEITIEDIRYLTSPPSRSYGAIRLMKQLSEHTTSTYADAVEALGNETPESIVKGRCSHNPNMNKEKHQMETELHSASNILPERLILDFSECESAGKGTENLKSSTAMSFSSLSSYLLKGYR